MGYNRCPYTNRSILLFIKYISCLLWNLIFKLTKRYFFGLLDILVLGWMFLYSLKYIQPCYIFLNRFLHKPTCNNPCHWLQQHLHIKFSRQDHRLTLTYCQDGLNSSSTHWKSEVQLWCTSSFLAHDHRSTSRKWGTKHNKGDYLDTTNTLQTLTHRSR